MMKRYKVIAGIVAYNPDILKLKKNINSIINQVDELVIVDNGSYNLSYIDSLIDAKNVKVIFNKSNKGIAYALNQIMEYGETVNADWCVTLDQDSISPDNYIKEASELFIDDKIGLITPLIFESSSGEYCYLGVKANNQKYQEINKAITSASITSIKVWKKIGKFDDKLFIDYVDYDFSIRVIKSGYKIIRVNNSVLNHEIGDSCIKKILGKNLLR